MLESSWLEMLLFGISIVSGTVGIYLMVMGARAITKKDFKGMSYHHFGGVLFLTFSALFAWIETDDASYLLMQLPFVVATFQAYLNNHDKPAKKWLQWWSFKWTVGINVVLIIVGLLSSLVIGWLNIVQVISAAAVSSGLALANEQRVLKLATIGGGRLGLFVSSAVKFYLFPNIAAALVWTILMAWATFESFKELKKVVKQEQ